MMSKIVKILFKIRFIPVKNDDTNSKITFKLCSFVTFTFIAVYWGVAFLISAISLQTMFRAQDVVMEGLITKNAIDSASIFAYGVFQVLFLLCPIFLGHALPSIQTIAQAKDLKWPKHGFKHVASYFLCAFGAIAFVFCDWLEVLKEKNIPDQIPILLCFSQAASQLVFNLYWVAPALLVSAWMQKFTCLCKYRAIGKEVSHAKECIKIYSDFNSGFGTYFFFVFGVSQVFVIFSLFLTISRVIGSNGTVLAKLIFSLGNLSVSFGLMLNIAGLTFILDAGHRSMKSLASTLQDQLMHVTDVLKDKQSRIS